MDENATISKERKRTTLFMQITVSLLLLTNASFVFTRQDKFSEFMPLSIFLCAVSVVLATIGLFSVILNYKKLTEKKRSVICAAALLVFCGLEISICVSAVTDMNAKRNAENSAVLFVKEKYGIDAEADYQKSNTFSDGDKLTTVKMTADGKAFTVALLTDSNDLTTYADSYQLDGIKQAVFDEVNRVYPDGTLYGVGILSSNFLLERVVEKFFDGTNLDGVMDGQRGEILIDYAGTKFDLDNPLFEKLNKWNIQPYFISFDSAAHLEEFVRKKEARPVYIRDEQYAKYAPYITDCVEYSYNKESNKGEIIRKSYNIKSGGEFDYLYQDVAENEKGSEKIEQRFAKYADTVLGKPVTKAYKRGYGYRPYSGSPYFIYYPLEKLNGATVENIEAAWISDSAGSNNAFGTQKAEVCGDYAVFALPYYAEEFMIVDTKGIVRADSASGS